MPWRAARGLLFKVTRAAPVPNLRGFLRETRRRGAGFPSYWAAPSNVPPRHRGARALKEHSQRQALFSGLNYLFAFEFSDARRLISGVWVRAEVMRERAKDTVTFVMGFFWLWLFRRLVDLLGDSTDLQSGEFPCLRDCGFSFPRGVNYAFFV